MCFRNRLFWTVFGWKLSYWFSSSPVHVALAVIRTGGSKQPSSTRSRRFRPICAAQKRLETRWWSHIQQIRSGAEYQLNAVTREKRWVCTVKEKAWKQSGGGGGGGGGGGAGSQRGGCDNENPLREQTAGNQMMKKKLLRANAAGESDNAEAGVGETRTHTVH